MNTPAQAEILQPTNTVGALVASGTATLRAAGVPTARLEAEVLLARACGIDRAGLYARWCGVVPSDCRSGFDSLVVRRQRREPLQYIVGNQEFWSLDFVVTPDVLIPRPETELLVEMVVAVLGRRAASLRLCDLGTGSGCIAVALARELPLLQVWALDISEAALDVAQINARRHGVAERIHFQPSDAFSAANDGLRFDAIVCNPPYVPSRELQTAPAELAWEPRHALDGGPAGLTVIERIVAEAPRYLEEGGWLLMEMGADQRAAVEQLARAAGFSLVSVRTDYAGLPRALVAQR
jgi:release factor glutamine methyltransferase